MLARRLPLAIGLLLALAPSALAFDLTGTWIGTRTCAFLTAGVKSKVVREGTVEISQMGWAVGFDSAIGSAHLYSGVANFLTEKPDRGEFSLHHCRNHVDVPTFEALGRFTASTKPGKVKATIKGISIVANDSTLDQEHGTCKWKLTRTSTADPQVSSGCGVVLSRRAAKTDVAYLSDAEVKRLYDELLTYRLATYRYARPELGPGSRLGFMIDDVAPSASVAPDGDHVDLYAYTSMAVAAVQTQAREIARLQRAISALEARAATASGGASSRSAPAECSREGSRGRLRR
ncbi:MAG: hypothetical protein IT294_17455 [Deltaproteobacteria bacterium]|nr:hypothetical protein [Deltaproteobacteria bacterium]